MPKDVLASLRPRVDAPTDARTQRAPSPLPVPTTPTPTPTPTVTVTTVPTVPTVSTASDAFGATAPRARQGSAVEAGGAGEAGEADAIAARLLARRREPQGRGGLPQTVVALASGMTVAHGTDAGDFYCEHAFFMTTREALRADTSVLRNDKGEVLTGFLHIPADALTYARDDAKVQSERHRDGREIIGAAVRGFYEDARAQIGDGPFRMLLTGYLQWGTVVDNPSGDFVSHRENLDAAMKRAFGAELVGDGKLLESATTAGTPGTSRDRYEYFVKDATSPTGERAVIIEAARLPVADAAIDGGVSSLQVLMAGHRPHAVMSMGVTGGSAVFLAELHADDGGLRTEGAIGHDDAKRPATSHPDNFALARALHRGQRLIHPRSGDV